MGIKTFQHWTSLLAEAATLYLRGVLCCEMQYLTAGS